MKESPTQTIHRFTVVVFYTRGNLLISACAQTTRLDLKTLKLISHNCRSLATGRLATSSHWFRWLANQLFRAPTTAHYRRSPRLKRAIYGVPISTADRWIQSNGFGMSSIGLISGSCVEHNHPYAQSRHDEKPASASSRHLSNYVTRSFTTFLIYRAALTMRTDTPFQTLQFAK